MKMANYIPSQSIKDIFDDLDYNSDEIVKNLLEKTNNTSLQDMLSGYINDNSYLKTINIQGNK